MPTRRRTTALAVAAAAALTAPAAAHASTHQYTMFEAPREMASASDAQRQHTLDEIRAFGVSHMRVLMYWNRVVTSRNHKRKPHGFVASDPNSSGYDWSTYDAILREAAARHISIMLTPTGPVPRWATGHHHGHTYKPSDSAFEQFVEAAGRRYGSQVNIWSIWNEPNHPDFLTPQFSHHKPEAPHLYRGLYKAALKGLSQSGNGHDRVLAGETAPRGTPHVVSPIAFLRIFFHGKKLKVSGYAHHPYTTKVGPWFVPPAHGDVTIGVLGRLTRALDKYSHHKRLPVYLTEFGIQSTPDPYVGVSQSKQNEYRAISEQIAYRHGRVKAFSQYLMRDDKPLKGSPFVKYSGFQSGLRFSSGRKKLSYGGFRLPLVADHSGSHVKLWGLVRPNGGGHSRVLIQYRGHGSHKWHKLAVTHTNKRGYFHKTKHFRSRRVYRVVWTDPGSAYVKAGTVFRGPGTHAYRIP